MNKQERKSTESLTVLWARFQVWCFQMYHILHGRIEWQEEIIKQTHPGEKRMIVTYVGAYRKKREKKPGGGHVTTISRVAFYEEPLDFYNEAIGFYEPLQ